MASLTTNAGAAAPRAPISTDYFDRFEDLTKHPLIQFVGLVGTFGVLGGWVVLLLSSEPTEKIKTMTCHEVGRFDQVVDSFNPEGSYTFFRVVVMADLLGLWLVCAPTCLGHLFYPRKENQVREDRGEDREQRRRSIENVAFPFAMIAILVIVILGLVSILALANSGDATRCGNTTVLGFLMDERPLIMVMFWILFPGTFLVLICVCAVCAADCG